MTSRFIMIKRPIMIMLMTLAETSISNMSLRTSFGGFSVDDTVCVVVEEIVDTVGTKLLVEEGNWVDVEGISKVELRQ